MRGPLVHIHSGVLFYIGQIFFRYATACTIVMYVKNITIIFSSFSKRAIPYFKGLKRMVHPKGLSRTILIKAEEEELVESEN